MSPTCPDESGGVPTTTAVRRAPGYVLKRTKRWLVRQYYARYFVRNPDHRALSAERARAAVADARGILFLCWGNVCRSPMAERYLRSRLDERGVEDVTVRSAGWGEREGRPSPPDAVESADRHGVDLTDHRSRRLDRALVTGVDVAFVMDYNDYHELTSRYPRVAEDTFFLRTMLGDARETPRIPDPNGRGPAQFAAAYGSIARASDEVAAAIDGDDDGPPGAPGGPNDG